MKDLMPVLKTLKQNKIGGLLVALQIAITLCVMLNAWVMVDERNQNMSRPSGLDEENLFTLSSIGFSQDYNERFRVDEDLRMIKELDGVVDAVQMNAIPLSGGGWSMGLALEQGDEAETTGTAIYMVDEHGIDALGVKLIAGENFNPNDIEWRTRTSRSWGTKAIVTKALADELFPDHDWEHALGKTVFIAGTRPLTIVGIIETLQAPWNGWNGVERSTLIPQKLNFGFGRYMVRTEPGMRDQVLPLVEDMLAKSDRGRIIRSARTMSEIRERSYRDQVGLNAILKTVVTALLIITGLGLVGLTTYNLNRRKKQIGTRRALGATKWDIVRYFLTESFVVATIGVFIGGALAIGLNMLLVDQFGVQPMDWYFIPAGMGLLWLLGFLSVIGPAKIASDLPPALATRTV